MFPSLRLLARVLGLVAAVGLLAPAATAAAIPDTISDTVVAWQPPPGENGPDFTARVKIIHSLAGGPGVAQIAKDYTLGAFVVQQGRKIPVAAIPEDLRSKIRIISVDIAYDILPRGATQPVSTKRATNVAKMDMLGVGDWSTFFPGRTADQAKDLFRGGYTITNVRITKAYFSTPDLSAVGGESEPAAGGQPLPAQWEEVGFARDGNWIFIRHADGRIERFNVQGGPETVASPPAADLAGASDSGGGGRQPCRPPAVHIWGRIGAYCVTVGWGELMPGMNLGPVENVRPNYAAKLQIEYRRRGDAQWTIEFGEGALLAQRDLFNLDPGTQYDLRALAICEDGTRSEYSPIQSFTTAAPSPSIRQITNITRQSASVSVLVPANPCDHKPQDELVLQYAKGSGPWLDTGNWKGPITLTDLEPGTNYRVRVATRFKNGVLSAYSREASFKTLR